jgi:phosphoglycolate phosphatase
MMKHDIIGAEKTGLLSIGVTYGYGGYDELFGAGADVVVSSVEALHKYLLNHGE